MKAVLDASVFFSDIPLEGDLFTTPSVCDELVDIRAKGNFEKLCTAGLTVVSPARTSLQAVDRAAEKSRDSGVISGTDRDLLALAKELGAMLYTDDFAIQNVAGVLGVRTHAIFQRKARPVRWKYRCTGCGRYYSHDGDCPVCGAAIKRKLK
ncbi:NOB1 family endonuclease [Methanoregula formicica]|uniref:Putative nucleic acid-binding protein with PIN domain and Zn ribbon n=1 Tax=Methanoregula formicica (strain DSM 22288 / NBRC 105244 / SMSP) TaxID=593750 RepID=L0HC40_METFS|nr:nucleic acid-binding protein [Methanoregula formicica]AGB01371.1 putative nucleic acid-binding protein with PIN domain and Zn ribbon [Methanoregula formicica SMSP]